MGTAAKTNNLHTSPRWRKQTRWLHALVAASLSIQLIVSLFMAHPDHLDKANVFEKLAWEGHEWVGLFAAAALLLHWIWLFMSNSDVKFRNLFPWSSTGMKQISNEVIYLLKNRKFPPLAEHGGLSGFIHGLGILIATFMAASGVALYLVMDFTASGLDNSLYEQIAFFHSLASNLMWTYLIGHLMASVWHEYFGEKILAGIRP